MGDDEWGKKYLDNLTKFNVSTSHVEVVKAKNTGTAHINVADNGENQIVIIPGAHDLLAASDVEKALDVLDHTKVILYLNCSPFLLFFSFFIEYSIYHELC